MKPFTNCQGNGSAGPVGRPAPTSRVAACGAMLRRSGSHCRDAARPRFFSFGLRSVVGVVGCRTPVRSWSLPPRSVGRTESTSPCAWGSRSCGSRWSGMRPASTRPCCRPTQAERVVEQASRIEKIAATLKALAAARVAETGSWRAEGDRSAAHHLARRTGTTVVQAAAAIDTARRLEALPETSAAARRGELSAEQTSAIADAAGADPGAERASAGGGPALAPGRAARAVRPDQGRGAGRSRGPPGPHPPAPLAALLHRRRGRVAPALPQQPRGGGQRHGRPRPFREAIFRQARTEARREPPDAYAADALAEMARRSADAIAERCRLGRRRRRRPTPSADAERRRRRRPPAAADGGAARPGPTSRAGGGRPGRRGRPRSSCGSTWGRCCGAGRSRGRCARSPGSGRWRCPRCGT